MSEPLFAARITALQHLLKTHDLDAFLTTPGPDFDYLTGYFAMTSERLSAAIIPATGTPVLIVPELERGPANASPALEAGYDLQAWNETDDAYQLAADILGKNVHLSVSSQTTANHMLPIQEAATRMQLSLGEHLSAALRRVKTADEVSALTEAGRAIDAVHARIPELLRPGRTEAEVAREISDLMFDAGHVSADFVIVAAGAGAASPHHETGDTVLQSGECVLVDIGGRMSSGYRSDCTRNFYLGQPTAEYAAAFAVLQEAQELGVQAVAPGVSAQEIDRVVRQHITEAGYGEYFMHRTGHGIGLETHEHPYIVEGNEQQLVVGDCFSIEPGIYIPGKFGMRIEDIVVCTPQGGTRLNNVTRDVVEIPVASA